MFLDPFNDHRKFSDSIKKIKENLKRIKENEGNVTPLKFFSKIFAPPKNFRKVLRTP